MIPSCASRYEIPIKGTVDQNGKWHCPNCLEKMEEKKDDTQIG